jgi:hypothetical protein
MNSAFPGRRRKAEMKHEKRESPAVEAKEAREERMAMKRPTLKLKKRGK